MSEPICVALIGFSAFERQALASYFNVDFQSDHQLGPSYRLVPDIDRARYIVADADQPGTATLLRQLERSSDTVFVGAQAPSEAAAWVMRPISPTHLRRELDNLQVQRDLAHGVSMPLSMPFATPQRPHVEPPRSDEAPRRPAGEERRRSSTASLNPQQRRELAEERRRQRLAALRPQITRRALVVDDSDVARAYLRRLLEPYAVEIDEAAHSDEALDQLAQRRYGVVFMDVDLGPISVADGLALCHTVRHQMAQPPLLVLVSAFHGPVDRVRGTLAGADAYLGKPLDPFELDRLMQAQGFSRDGVVLQRGDPQAGEAELRPRG